MAALQKIRSKSALLIIVIGLAMFAFIAGDLFNSIETTFNAKRMQVGEVYGEDLSVQDYQTLVEEATQTYKMFGNVDNDNIRDEVWSNFVSQKIIQNETDELGLTVTDEEMQNALREGTASSLRALSFFTNQQTGRFDVTALQNFLKQYKELGAQAATLPAEQIEQFQMIYDMWVYAEKNLRQELLMNKFNALLQASFISNPIVAKMQFDANNVQNAIELAALPYYTVEDKDITVEDSDLKAMYEKYKELFVMDAPTRDIKYIDVVVTASDADRKALNEKMNELYERLQKENAADVVNSSKSDVSYADLALAKTAFPQDIQNILDSMAVGSTKAPYLNAGDNTMNIVKLIAKEQMPDSVLSRAIGVMGATEEETAKRADSIYNALTSGASFAEIAKKYGQPTDSVWTTGSQYEGYALSDENVKYIKSLMSTPTNGFAKVDMGQGKLIIQVLDRKALKTKYNAAVIKCPIDFSKDTYREALNNFNRFIAANRTLEDIEKNAAKNGYVLRTLEDFTSSAHNVANVSETKDAIRWIFDEAEVGDVSKLYECGANDHLLLVAVTGIHEQGYRDREDPKVKEALTALVKNEKKAAVAMERAKGVKDMAAAKQLKGVVADSLTVGFGQSPYVAVAMAPEAVISGAAAKTEAGKFAGPVAGGSGVYMVQVLSKNPSSAEFNLKSAMTQAAQMDLRLAGQQLFESLYIKAEVVDNRYKF